MNHLPQAPENNIKVIKNFPKICGDNPKSRCIVINDTSGKFASGVNNTGGNFRHKYRVTPVANNGNNIRLPTP
jgi:hypothetical protein